MLHLTSKVGNEHSCTLLPHTLPKRVKVHLYLYHYLYLYEDKTLRRLSITIQTSAVSDFVTCG
jgi:hypothetical protein